MKIKYKTVLYLFIILFFSSSFNYAQIDTTMYFPLKTGNFWEYWGVDNWTTDWIKLTIESTGDTTMPNGKTYHKMEAYTYNDSLPGNHLYNHYYRFESSKIYKYHNVDSCLDSEYILYDFNIPDSTIWQICPLGFANYRGIHSTGLYFSTTFNMVVEEKLYDYVDVNGQDTIWAPMGAPTAERIAKGIGMINQLVWGWITWELYGARINGQVYGTLTSVNNNIQELKTFELFQNYPNPFNPLTTISYELPVKSFVTLKVYNTLGEEITTLVNEEKSAGTYEVKFDGSNLPSGVYIYRLVAGNHMTAKKLVLLK